MKLLSLIIFCLVAGWCTLLTSSIHCLRRNVKPQAFCELFYDVKTEVRSLEKLVEVLPYHYEINRI